MSFLTKVGNMGFGKMDSAIWYYKNDVYRGPGGSMSKVVGSNNSYKPITNTVWIRAPLCKLQKGCTRHAAASDNIYSPFYFYKSSKKNS